MWNSYSTNSLLGRRMCFDLRGIKVTREEEFIEERQKRCDCGVIHTLMHPQLACTSLLANALVFHNNLVTEH